MNFNADQIRSTTSREFRPFKEPAVPDPRVPRSLQKLLFKGSPVLDQYKGEIDAIIEE